jgi:hypothetical protein
MLELVNFAQSFFFFAFVPTFLTLAAVGALPG